MAFDWALASMGSILVAVFMSVFLSDQYMVVVPFIMLPLIFSLPLMKSCCALVLPETILPKFSSDNERTTVEGQHKCCVGTWLCLPSAFFPAGASPFATLPDSFKSMCQASSFPDAFLSLKAKIAWPCLMAFFCSAGSDVSASLMASKAAEDGKASKNCCQPLFFCMAMLCVPSLSPILKDA